jgi:hypothetical protein
MPQEKVKNSVTLRTTSPQTEIPFYAAKALPLCASTSQLQSSRPFANSKPTRCSGYDPRIE